MIYQYPTQFDVDILASSMLHVGTFDAEILSLERLRGDIHLLDRPGSP